VQQRQQGDDLENNQGHSRMPECNNYGLVSSSLLCKGNFSCHTFRYVGSYSLRQLQQLQQQRLAEGD
jgi:hypothetical protein